MPSTWLETQLQRWSDLDLRERADRFRDGFLSTANGLAMAYGGPLYLVGTLLTSSLPGDVDLRLMLERDQMELWFGRGFDDTVWKSPSRLRLEREQLKQSVRLSRRFRGYPTHRYDFQFQCVLVSETDGLPIMDHVDKPRLRLDSIPLSCFRAGWSDP